MTLTHDFWIGKTEITHSQWESDSSYVGWDYYNSASDGFPCTGTLADCPADSISWYDVALYANALSTAEGYATCYKSDGTSLAAAYAFDPYSCPGYRMPTEAEWEYAARAGEDTTYSGSNTAADVAWTSENTYSLGTYTHEGCSLAENAWGLCDMSGNLYEWTNDWYSGTYGGYGSGFAAADPAGPSSGSDRVFRGGNFYDTAAYATVSYRIGLGPGNRSNDIGARLVRTSLP